MSIVFNLAQFGWGPAQRDPVLTQEQKDTVDALEEAIWADEAPWVMLDPRELIPCQNTIELPILEGLVGVEYVPAILVIKALGKLHVHDGHHRTVRALLDNQLVRSVVFDADKG